MNIAIVTVYDSFVNVGSFLQGYALGKLFEEMGHKVYFVQRMPEQEILDRFNNLCITKNTVSREVFLWPLRQLRRNLMTRIEIKNNTLRFRAAVEDWKKINIISKDQLELNGINVIVCGSDEIWNVNNNDMDLEFYTCGWTTIPKIAIAVSSGDTTSDLLTDSIKENISKFVECIPRDEMTQKLLRDIVKSTAPCISDPTILLGKRYFSDIKSNHIPNSKYMVIYSYVYNNTIKKNIIKYARQNSLKIVSPCIDCDFADEIIFCSALEFPDIIRNAECMYTSTFHGTIFGLMFAKSLCCYPRLPKVYSIIENLGAQTSCIKSSSTFEEMKKCLENEIKHEEVDKRLEQLAAEGKSIIKDVLNSFSA